MINHLAYIRKAVTATIPAEKQPRLIELLDLAQNCICACVRDQPDAGTGSSRYEEQIRQYMEALFSKIPAKPYTSFSSLRKPVFLCFSVPALVQNSTRWVHVW